MWLALCLVLAAAVLGSLFGLGIAKVIIETGLCGHPQCQPGAKKQNSPEEHTLMEMNGPISDRLREKFDKNDEVWFPPRDETEPVKNPLPKGRDGWSVTGRGKKK